MVHGNDAITVSEKLKGVIAPLIMDENNANLHRERKSKQPKLHITDQKFALYVELKFYIACLTF